MAQCKNSVVSYHTWRDERLIARFKEIWSYEGTFPKKPCGNKLGPSRVSYLKNGLKWAEEYRDGYVLHRVDGPAYTVHDILPKHGFYLRGSEYTFERWIEAVKDKISEERYNHLVQNYGKL